MTSSLLAHFHEQARACRAYGSPFTAELIERLAQDLEQGGPVADLVEGWPRHPRADAVALRLAGALHAAALTNRDPPLAESYPRPGKHPSMNEAWPRVRAFLARDRDWVARYIQSPPQTNEVRRAIALLIGFLAVAEAWDGPIETLELGASAGLNLHWDRFAYRTQSWEWNPGGRVAIDTDWHGPPPPVHLRPHVRARAACDQHPLDVSDPEQRLRLASYIWPDQPERLARFHAAADLASEAGVQVECADAGPWLEQKLAQRPHDACLVVYHSIFLQYPPSATRQRLSDALASAGARAHPDAPLAWLRLEPEALLGGPPNSQRFLLDLTTWPHRRHRTLLETDGHVRCIHAL